MRAIFISYRREDAEGQAGRLFADLVKHFGEQAVFMDVATIEPGRDFRKAIDEHVGSCGVLLSLIGKDWLDAKDAGGQRRLDDETDFVRLETASALKREIPVVPVLVQGARMPRAEQLPVDLRDLAYRNAIELTHARWDTDLSVLIKALSRYITAPNAPASEPVRSAPPVSPSPAPKSKLLAIIGVAALVIAAGAFFFLSGGTDDRPVATLAENSGTDSPIAADAPKPKTEAVRDADVKAGAADVPARATEPPARESPQKPAAKQAQPEEPPAEQPVPPAATPPSAERNTLFGLADWDHDGHADIVSRQNSNAMLWLYPGASKRGAPRTRRVQIGNGWNGFSPFGVVDWDGDGHQDIVTRNDTSGQLMLYPGQSQRAPSTSEPVSIGVGWNGITFFGAADWDGDGHQDIVVRNDTSGDLMLYPGEGVRRMSNAKPSKIGNGWKGFTFVGMADWDGDGKQDIVTRNDTTGDLLLYPGEGVRRMSNIQPSKIGDNWNGFSFFGITDWDGDGHQDIVTRNDSNGDLMLYLGESSRKKSGLPHLRIAAGFDLRG